MPHSELAKWILYWAAVLAGLAAMAALVFGLHAVAPPERPEILHIVQGQIADTSEGNWDNASLPDDWLDSRPRARDVWYRFHFELPSGARELMAVYLPTVMQNAAVYVNGEPVGDGGRFEPPVARNWPGPLMFPVSPDLLREGDNEIALYVATQPAGAGLLSDFYFGPRDALIGTYDFRYALKVTAPMAFVVMLLILAAMLASITLRRPADTVYAWFATILVILACYTLGNLPVEIPVSTAVWDWFRITNIGWGVLFITVFTHRFVGVRRPRIEWAMAGVFTAGVVAVALIPSQTYYQWAGSLWVGLCMATGAYPAVLLGAHVMRERRLENLLLLMAGLSLLLFGGHDSLMVARIAPRLDGYMLPYATPLVAVVFTWILLAQFIEARREAEALNRDLEARVRDKAAELEAEHARRLQLEAERAVMEERERLMRDMHDGVGGQLASAVSLLENPAADADAVGEVLRQATDDLRLIIHSFEPTGKDLGGVLGLLRPRLQRRLDAAGIELDWRIGDTAPVAGLGPRMALQIMRIVQETVSNAIKHSGAGRVTVRSFDDGDAVVLEVADDGAGLPEAPSNGYGLGNMRERAQGIEAQIDIADTNQGVRVSLCLRAASG